MPIKRKNLGKLKLADLFVVTRQWLIGVAMIGLWLPLNLTASVDFKALASTATEHRVQKKLEQFSGFASRVVGYPGATAAAELIQREFRSLHLDNIAVHEFDVSVPIEKGGKLRVLETDRAIRLHGLWPNLVRTSTLPAGGLQTHLIDAQSGRYESMDGLNVEGAAVLMDFNSGDAWVNAAQLGAKAIVFIEPDSTVYLEGEKKFLSLPLDIPRFWVNKTEGKKLRADLRVKESIKVHLEYRMDWERKSAWNIIGTIPGYDPLLTNDIVVLEGYYDAMSVVPALAPGAEQAASVTALLEIARHFRENPPARTVVFLATSAPSRTTWSG